MVEKEKYKDLFQLIPFPCLVLKPVNTGNFLITEANDAYLEVSGTLREDITGRLSCEVFPEKQGFKDDAKILEASLQMVLCTAEKNKTKTFRYDIPVSGTKIFKEKYWIAENIPVRGDKGEVNYILHTVKDVTEQVIQDKNHSQIKRELSKNEQQYRHFIKNNPDGLYSLDLKGKFTSANEGLAKIAEVPLQKLMQMDFLPFCAPEDRERIIEKFQEGISGKNTKFEASFVSAKGEKMILAISLMPIKVNTEVVGVYGIAKDLTGIRKTEKIVVEKRKFLEANTTFISSLVENEFNETELKEIFGIIGNAVSADRMYYFDVLKGDSGRTFISQKIEWSSDNATAQNENPEMQNIPGRKVKEILTPLEKNQTFTANLSELKEGYLKEVFLDQDIKAMLILPVFFKNDLYGFIGFDDCKKERVWNEDEITFLKGLSNILTAAIEKNAAEKAVKEREAEIKRSEKKFKALVQEGSDLMGIMDLEGNYKFVSETTTAILGLRPEEFIGKNAFDFIHPEDKERVIKQYQSLTTQKQVKISPFRFVDRDGNWRWLETTLTNLMEDPAIKGIVHNTRDITNLRAQALEIKQINERYSLAARATQDIIYDWNLQEDKVVRFQKCLKHSLGYTSAEVNSPHFWRDKIHKEDLEKEKTKLEEAFKNPEINLVNTEYRFLRKDGSYAYMIDRGYILRNEQGKAVRMVGAASDISEIRKKEEALKIANKRFKRAMKATNEMIWDWDLKRDIIIRSKGYNSIFGFPIQQSYSGIETWLKNIIPSDRKRVKNSIEKVLKENFRNQWKAEYCLIKANGEEASVVDRGYVVRNKNGEAVRLVGAVLDVTESRKMIKGIKKQNDLLKEITWQQCHLVRAPLARIMGLIPLLKNDEDEWTQEEVLEHISSSAQELDKIIRGIINKSEKIGVFEEESS